MADKKTAGSEPSPPGKRETLTSRAKRIIGRVLDNSDEPTTPTEASRQGVRKSPTRRREQVLQAQRTHRQRTQGYIRELEKEVLRLREREGILQSENDGLNSKFDILKETLIVNGIAIPESVDSSVPQTQHVTPAASGFSTTSGGLSSTSSVSIDLTDLANIEPEKWCSATAAIESPRQYEAPTISPSKLSEDLESTGTSILRTSSPGHYGSTPALNPQAGIDFVLELERPCLPHVKYRYMQENLQMAPLSGSASPDFNAGPGHVFLATSTLLNSHHAENPSTQTFGVPPADIEQLFRTSLTLDLGPDVTPIQVWANIRRISAQYPVDITMLRILKDEFMKYVRCNSFGAVVERSTASSVLSFFFPGEEFTTIWT